MNYRIFTSISGGVTGNRSAFIKGPDGREAHFKTAAQAKAYIDLCLRNHSGRFQQTYTVYPCADDDDRLLRQAYHRPEFR